MLNVAETHPALAPQRREQSSVLVVPHRRSGNPRFPGESVKTRIESASANHGVADFDSSRLRLAKYK